jgi:hypothetical protein
VRGSQVKFQLAYSTKMSAEVTFRIFARPLTVGDNPNSSAYEPTLRQYAGAMYKIRFANFVHRVARSAR